VNTGTYQAHAALAELPTLVRRQRRLEKVVAQVTKDDLEQEKACRALIDALLVKAGLGKGELVTCNGYDVIHHEQKGRTTLNQDTLIEELVAAGVERDVVVAALTAAEDTADPVKFALVKPTKGAQVRKA